MSSVQVLNGQPDSGQTAKYQVPDGFVLMVGQWLGAKRQRGRNCALGNIEKHKLWSPNSRFGKKPKLKIQLPREWMQTGIYSQLPTSTNAAQK
ncbi:MAG: hypothetical protein AAF572_05505 [Cyanobacteria bacterium P01_B01_bin.77]